MTNREKLYEIAGRLGADADLAVVRAALLALIRVLLGVATEPLAVTDGAAPRATADADDARAAYRAKWISVLEALDLPPGDFDAVGAILRLRRDIEKARVERVATLGGALTKPGTAREPPEQRGSAIEDILRERDAMVARSRRGIQRDDEKTPEDWAASLRKVSDPAHPIVSYDAPWTLRRMWVQIGAVALRAVESIDRKGEAISPSREALERARMEGRST